MSMGQPAPDALLMAKLLTEWPASDGGGSVDEVFFYIVRKHKEKMAELGYVGDCGIGKPRSRRMDIPRYVKQLEGADVACVALVFVPDTDTVGGSIDGNLGRDISKYEWQMAREYLINQESNHGS